MNANHPLCAVATAAILLSLDATVQSFAQESSAEPSPPAAVAPQLATCSPDGEFFVVLTSGGRLTYGRTSDGATLRTFYQCHPKALEFSPNGQLLASVGESNGSPARIKVWNVADGTLLCRMETEGGRAPLLRFSPDGLLLVSTDGGSQVNFWQLPEGTLKCSTTMAQPISCIAFSNEGDALVAICADAEVLRISAP